MESVKVRVARNDPETGKSGWSEFNVDVREKTTVLDCLDQVQRASDPSLGFRYACRVGMCGSCAMVVNGKDRWTCRTLVQRLEADTITIEPLRNLPVIRDLAVDFTPLWKKYRHIRPAFESGGAKRMLKAEVRRRREKIDRNVQCISCAICYSSCGYVASDPAYFGPHALLRAFTAVEDPRDGATDLRLRLVDNEHGCWKCHIQMNCTNSCPMDLDPSEGIQHLKRAVLYRRLLNPTRRKFAFTMAGAAVAAVVGYVVYAPKEWITVGPVDTVPTNTFLEFDRDGKRAFIRRIGEQIQAFSQRCSHQGCKLVWSGSSNEFLCPCHRGVFDRAGIPISGPPVRPIEQFETRIESGMVQVFL